MLFLNALRWFIGSVEFTAEGGFPERFVSLMGSQNIPAQSILPTPLGLHGSVRPGLYHQLRPIARKSGMRMRICGRHGLPFLVYRYHRRTGLFVGMLLLSAMLMVMQLFVWKVDIVGCETLEEEQIIEYLADLGVKEGAFLPSIDSTHVERKLLLQLPELSWAAVNIQGSTIEVSLRERIIPPVLVDKNGAANVISGGTGIVREMEVYDGQPLVELGEPVWEGRLLVAGVFDANQRTVVSYARAKIIAEIEDSLTVEIPFEQEVERATGQNASQIFLQFDQREILLNPWTRLPEKSWISRSVLWEPPAISWLNWLPKVVRQTYEGCEQAVVHYSPEEAKELAIAMLEKRERIEFEKFGYLERSLTGEARSDRYLLVGFYRRLEDIAVTQEILINQ